MTCKHYLFCAHYCALTESCDYMLDTGQRRPHPASACPGYPLISPRRLNIRLPGSLDFGNFVTGGRENAGA